LLEKLSVEAELCEDGVLDLEIVGSSELVEVFSKLSDVLIELIEFGLRVVSERTKVILRELLHSLALVRELETDHMHWGLFASFSHLEKSVEVYCYVWSIGVSVLSNDSYFLSLHVFILELLNLVRISVFLMEYWSIWRRRSYQVLWGLKD
jgi:hypothetical protein